MADSFNTMKIRKNNVFMMYISYRPRITCCKKRVLVAESNESKQKRESKQTTKWKSKWMMN